MFQWETDYRCAPSTGEAFYAKLTLLLITHLFNKDGGGVLLKRRLWRVSWFWWDGLMPPCLPPSQSVRNKYGAICFSSGPSEHLATSRRSRGRNDYWLKLGVFRKGAQLVSLSNRWAKSWLSASAGSNEGLHCPGDELFLLRTSEGNWRLVANLGLVLPNKGNRVDIETAESSTSPKFCVSQHWSFPMVLRAVSESWGLEYIIPAVHWPVPNGAVYMLETLIGQHSRSLCFAWH